MSKRKNTLVAFVAIGVIATLGIMVARQVAASRAASESTATETAIVQRGDVTITVDAAGSLASPTEFTLAFPVAGKIHEIFVSEGKTVAKGDLLARLEGNIQAEADFQALFSKVGVARAELALTHAQDALTYSVDDLAYLIGVEAYHWEGQLKQAEERLAVLNEDSSATAEQKSEAQKAVEVARGWRDYYRELNIRKLEKEYEDFEVFKTIRMKGQIRHILLDTISYKVDTELLLAYANWEDAKVNLQDAQAALEIVKAGPSALQSPLAALGPEMAQLEATRRNVENTRLIAPVDGVITKLNFHVGEIVSRGAPVAVVSNLTTLEAEVNLDETDVSRIQVGMPVVVSVDAFPGQKLNGQVTEIALSANVQSGVVLYPVTVRVDASTLPLLSGMTVNVAFPIEQRTDTLIVPYRAVETEGGQAYLTRVTASGSERVAVTLGLITDTQVEILSGVEEGDVVTVFDNPVQDTELMNDPIFGEG
jgi:multidrug efflux pump subunit AcrA (membrane-fusion protein)